MSVQREENSVSAAVYGEPGLPTIVYLPGLHGDCTISQTFREAMGSAVRFVEFTYPRSTKWTMADYGKGVADTLDELGIGQAWVIGESFGSQVLWALVEELAANPGHRFKPEALVMGGGFVRYPIPFLVWLSEQILRYTPIWCLRRSFDFYKTWSAKRRGGDERQIRQMDAFVARRNEQDRRAILHRLRLIRRHDPRSRAQANRIPLFYLTGAIDFVVPWMFVRPWVRKNCFSLRGDQKIRGCDHALFFSEPEKSAAQLKEWMRL